MCRIRKKKVLKSELSLADLALYNLSPSCLLFNDHDLFSCHAFVSVLLQLDLSCSLAWLSTLTLYEVYALFFLTLHILAYEGFLVKNCTSCDTYDISHLLWLACIPNLDLENEGNQYTARHAISVLGLAICRSCIVAGTLFLCGAG